MNDIDFNNQDFGDLFIDFFNDHLVKFFFMSLLLILSDIPLFLKYLFMRRKS